MVKSLLSAFEQMLGLSKADPNKKANLDHLFSDPSLINWEFISDQPWAISLLDKHPDRVYWRKAEKNPDMLPLLMKHRDRLDWNYLSTCEWAAHLMHNIDNTT